MLQKKIINNLQIFGIAGKVPQDPTLYSDKIGTTCRQNKTTEYCKENGIFLTPYSIAKFMASLIEPSEKSSLKIVDPAAGAGILLCAAVEAIIEKNPYIKHISVTAFEIDNDLVECLHDVLDNLRLWASQKNVEIVFDVKGKDFILACGRSITMKSDETYDIVIANPPYFKLNKADPRAQICSHIVHGQPNIYGLFMAVSASILKDKGQFIFITPRSFSSGPYFKRFRQYFFNIIRPDHFHIFASRKEAFKRDAVLQETVILKGIRSETLSEHCVSVTVSNSDALDKIEKSSLPISRIISKSDKEHSIILPTSKNEEAIIDVVQSWKSSLSDMGLKISTGPVVPFRAREVIFDQQDITKEFTRLLWMNHVHPLKVTWPNCRKKEEYIEVNKNALPILLLNKNYVLMRRFSTKEEKRRLVAAPYISSHTESSYIGVENHLNYIHRPGGTLTEEEAYGIAAFYSSELLDNYFRILNGNTQVSATELMNMPMPDLKFITQLGHYIKQNDGSLPLIDEYILSNNN